MPQKKLTTTLLLLLIAILGTWMLIRNQTPVVQDNRPITGLPWQIETHADGTSSVMGITLGKDSLGEGRKVLGPHMELAIIAGKDETGSLEAYYSRYTSGFLSGRMILVADLPPEIILKLKQNARKGFTGSGAYKFSLSKDDLPLALQAKIFTMTFIPQVNFDEEVILKRFGTPAEKIQSNPTLTHYLYPQKGLDLILDSDGKEVLQYTAPREFHRLVGPLKKGK